MSWRPDWQRLNRESGRRPLFRRRRRGRRFGLRRRLAGSFWLVAVLAVVLTAALTFGAGWRALSQIDPQLAAGAANAADPAASDPATADPSTTGEGSGLSAAQVESLRAAARSFGRSAWQAGLLASLLAAVVPGLVAPAAGPAAAAAGRRGDPGRGRGARGTSAASAFQRRAADGDRRFNSLAQGLERQEAWRRSLMADVAHDLRTPLAVLRAEIESIQDGLNAPDEHSMARLHAEVLLLARLVDDLRTLSLAEGHALTLHPATLNAGETLSQLLALFAGRVQAAGSSLSLHLPKEKLTFRADPDRLMQILHNLLDNALRYAAPATIELGASAEGETRLPCYGCATMALDFPLAPSHGPLSASTAPTPAAAVTRRAGQAAAWGWPSRAPWPKRRAVLWRRPTTRRGERSSRCGCRKAELEAEPESQVTAVVCVLSGFSLRSPRQGAEMTG